MDRANLERLVAYLGLDYRAKWRNSWYMFCCPYHGEHRPSSGINEESLFFSCFACEKKSVSLVELIAYVKGVSNSEAINILANYNFHIGKKEIKNDRKFKLTRYGETLSNNTLLQSGERWSSLQSTKSFPKFRPTYEMAFYKSGKVAHKYILARGFNEETCRKFNFGWDEDSSRVTIPLKWWDGKLCGFFKRAVIDDKLPSGEDNPEYIAMYGREGKYLLDGFEKTRLLFPLDHFSTKDGTAILVEGSLDAIRLHQQGFKNVLSQITASLHENQIWLLEQLGIHTVLQFLDNDKAGRTGVEMSIPLLRKHKIKSLIVPYLYEGKKDPDSMNKIQNRKCIEKAYKPSIKLARYN